MSSVVYLMIRDDFSVLSFGFADQNVILWSPVKFGGLWSRRLGVGRNLVSLCAVFWSILEHMGHEEHGGTWHMEAAQLDTQRKKGEAILKTSSTVYSTNRSSSSTRPAKLQLDRAEKSKSNPKNVASPLTFL
ncbi:unnamed protein product [Microthlaspi erraticum]|uniref:Uncharacterized protein n=1 Tax=Microthlaspi erraticum TaxID=1685480 RepID=A0A6D2IHT8_9BRAS|nr:unnamed protein product [Microthlaspi erraticum]